MGVRTPRPAMYDLDQDNPAIFQNFIHCLEDPLLHPSDLVDILDRFTLEEERLEVYLTVEGHILT
jgi:hypothetical protein